jgi:hypothetical protein
MIKGRTSKPCPGCGKSPEFGRPIDGVCGDCVKLMRDGQRYRRYVAKEKGGLIACWLPDTANNLPYIRYAGNAFNADDAFKAWRVLFYAEMLRVSVIPDEKVKHTGGRDERKVPSCHGGEEWRRYSMMVFMTPEDADRIDGLYKEVMRMIEHAYKEGQEEGKNFLAKLVTGEVSMSELQDGTRSGE